MLIAVNGKSRAINLGAEKYEEIIQNIRMILTTIKGTVPLDREFGIEATYIDSPTPIAMARMRVDIIEAIRKYEPRVSVSRISFEHDISAAMNGQLIPKVEVRVIGDI